MILVTFSAYVLIDYHDFVLHAIFQFGVFLGFVFMKERQIKKYSMQLKYTYLYKIHYLKWMALHYKWVLKC